jgi:sugar (pentulose or hexulose) kinase
MYLGIDLGTSGVKAVLVAVDGALLDQTTTPLSVSKPHPLWSEQDPAAWWSATQRTVAALRSRNDLQGVRGLGLSGQMHGAALLDKADRARRPAILWNDGRSGAECRALEAAEPHSRAISPATSHAGHCHVNLRQTPRWQIEDIYQIMPYAGRTSPAAKHRRPGSESRGRQKRLVGVGVDGNGRG